jgi:hypothetical protein
VKTVPVGAALNVGGAALLVAAAVGADSEHALADQLGWLSLGVTGLLIALTADVAIGLEGRRRLAAHRARLGRLPAVPRVLAPPPDEYLLVVAGATRFHRGGCQLVLGKTVSGARRSTHVSHGLRPCGVCQP